jgi:hypothetical protein
MLKHYLLWRIRRERRAGVYKIDSRRNEGAFGCGFYGFLDQTRFHQPAFIKRSSGAFWGQVVKRLLVIAAFGFVLWGVIESINALQVF